jgi:uncharacterized membrane protein YeaQ/YmgE (transglycosylase-associated protein family)
VSALIFVLVAAASGWVVDRMTPDRLPYGAGVTALAALIGSVLVALPLGDLGPHVVTVAVIPAVAGALGGAVVLRFILGRLTESRI